VVLQASLREYRAPQEKGKLKSWHWVISLALVLVLLAFIASPLFIEAAPDTVTIRPGSAGDETNLTPNTGANWAAVDEATSDNDTTYVGTTNDSYLTDLYNLPDVSVSGKGKINSVTAYINARAISTPEQPSAYTRIKTNNTTDDGTAQTLTTSYLPYNTAYTTNPQSGNEWTWAEINALQAGVGLQRTKSTGKLAERESRCTQVWVVIDYTPATLESYKEATHETVWGTVGSPYNGDTQTVYMYGTNFIASHSYHVAYYDGSGAKISSEGITSGADNTLSSQYLLTNDPSAMAGTWHAVVFDDDLGSPPNTYAECSGAAGYMVEDSFEVTESAIPEFSTVITAIAIPGLCFGIYYWMRKRHRRIAAPVVIY
jgi:uncharacterized membrane protein